MFTVFGLLLAESFEEIFSLNDSPVGGEFEKFFHFTCRRELKVKHVLIKQIQEDLLFRLTSLRE